MNYGICFAGGGIKGAAHIGAIKALEEENLKFDYISGTSSGSIIATLYAAGYSSDEMLKFFKKYAKKIKYGDPKNILILLINLFIKRKIVIKGFNEGTIIERLLNKELNKKNIKNISDIKKELLIPSIDINTGEINVFISKENRAKYLDNIIYINNVNIGKAVRASCSYPVVFAPCKINGKQLVDGGLRENVPWKLTKEKGADKVLSIIFDEEKNKKNYCKNILEVASNSLGILCHEISNYDLEGADYLLKIKTEKVQLLDYKKIDELYLKGYEQTKQKIKEIKSEVYPQYFHYLKVNTSLLEFIKSFKINGGKTAVASTARKKNLMNALDYIGASSYFDLILAGEDVSRGKPDPEIYLKVLEHFQMKPEEALVFEDSEVGIKAAENANISYIKINIS